MRFILMSIEERKGKTCERCGNMSLSVKYAVPKADGLHYYCNVCVTKLGAVK